MFTEKISNKHKTFMPTIVYKFRILGMGLGGIPVAVVLSENNSSYPYWLWWLFTCYFWPYLAFLRAKISKTPFLSERNNFIFDSFIAGTWVSLLHFNLLPAVLLLTITTADKISSGIKKLWMRSLPFVLAGILFPTLFTQFAFQPHTSTYVILACLPILLLHTFFVSLGSYKLIRKVQKQNTKLKKLSEIDFLTHVYNRRYWQEKVELMIENCKDSNKTASIILVDIDNFKNINDEFGHSIGDDVLKNIATTIKEAMPVEAIVGRFGGDEFAAVIPYNLSDSIQIAQLIRDKINPINHKNKRSISYSVSIGIAEIDKEKCNLRNWFDSADQYLYKAKSKGKNQIYYNK
jgi:diguanylate cyclase